MGCVVDGGSGGLRINRRSWVKYTAGVEKPFSGRGSRTSRKGSRKDRVEVVNDTTRRQSRIAKPVRRQGDTGRVPVPGATRT